MTSALVNVSFWTQLGDQTSGRLQNDQSCWPIDGPLAKPRRMVLLSTKGRASSRVSPGEQRSNSGGPVRLWWLPQAGR